MEHILLTVTVENMEIIPMCIFCIHAHRWSNFTIASKLQEYRSQGKFSIKRFQFSHGVLNTQQK